LENAIKIIYRKSWISRYFNVDTLSEEGIVFFFDNSAAKCRFLSTRFKVGLELPEITRLYFKPDSFWKNSEYPLELHIESYYLSNVLHGIQSNNTPGTKSVFYDPPYLLVYKTQGASSNYLSFTDYKKPNSESTILAILRYDDDKLMLKKECTTEILLPYQGNLCLNEILEFTLYDSKNKIVKVSDKSQLFILLSLL
jgi:hypothetical protein